MKVFEAEKLRDLIAFCQENNIEIHIDNHFALFDDDTRVFFHAEISIPKEKETKKP